MYDCILKWSVVYAYLFIYLLLIFLGIVGEIIDRSHHLRSGYSYWSLCEYRGRSNFLVILSHIITYILFSCFNDTLHTCDKYIRFLM